MRIKPEITLAALALVTSGMGCSGKQDSPPRLHWGPAPAIFPAGAMMALVSGDPSTEGPVQVLLSMPDGYKIPPHFHPTDEVIEVKQGTFLVGMGDSLDPKSAKPMNRGDKSSVPANMHHYVIVLGRTDVAVSARGPLAMIYVNTADDPIQSRFKP